MNSRLVLQVIIFLICLSVGYYDKHQGSYSLSGIHTSVHNGNNPVQGNFPEKSCDTDEDITCMTLFASVPAPEEVPFQYGQNSDLQISKIKLHAVWQPPEMMS